jgi:hypothetical protein
MNGVVLSVALLDSVSIGGGLLELAVLCPNHSSCGWSYVFNIIVISWHCGVCVCLCVCVLLPLIYLRVAEV